ncbi:hypothetical protein Pse7367_0321 [Thalassoporum mexicanum PCC 7367]|uniref:hypothetical protein n=1 Tax=Thalassoporum mexicanum TaxID=3457544 RepID=UPI00029FBD57|nr:hypothetical protein [Pseudanabaena sp. PCC 7367]AFY68634.1 hypothetical protein Pse7367_0321 [Pseudanabaena sp. PCC 7367]
MAKLILDRPQSEVKWCSLPQGWSGKPPEPRPNTWVQLYKGLNPYSDLEAKLLCKASEDEWIAWVPDHGEAVLHISQFCVYAESHRDLQLN